jgi:hypothetical protein
VAPEATVVVAVQVSAQTTAVWALLVAQVVPEVFAHMADWLEILFQHLVLSKASLLQP